MAPTVYWHFFQKVGPYSNFYLYNIINYWPIFQKVGRLQIIGTFFKKLAAYSKIKWQLGLISHHFSSYARNTSHLPSIKRVNYLFFFVSKRYTLHCLYRISSFLFEPAIYVYVFPVNFIGVLLFFSRILVLLDCLAEHFDEGVLVLLRLRFGLLL